SRSIDRAQGGLGIGLALVQRLIEMHDGSVTAYSEGHGRGSSFSVRVPIEPSAPKSESLLQRACPRQGRRILVLDDNVGAARMLAMLLTKRGDHIVETAHDGVSALSKTKEFRPDVVLLDLGLPRMDGDQVARAIRKMHEFRE